MIRSRKTRELHNDQEDVYHSLFGHKIVIPKLGTRPPSPIETLDWVHSPNRTGITSLPPEILLWIFKLLSFSGMHLAFPTVHYRDHLNLPECDCEEETIAKSRNVIFPYAQAQVCHHWRSILAIQPEFWTRIIVSRTRGVYTPPSAVEDYLLWSRDLPISVYVGNVGYKDHYDRERSLIQQYTKALSPHFHRCTVINYDVQYATSLPCLIRDLRAMPLTQASLKSFQLKSKEIHDPLEDAVRMDAEFYHHLSNMHVYFAVSRSGSRKFPFNKLILNGRNFLLALQYMPASLSAVNLEVTNYRADLGLHPEVEKHGSSELSCTGVLRSLTRLTTYHLAAFNNVQFTPLSHLANSGPALVDGRTLLFAQADSHLIMQAASLHPGRMSIIHCDLSKEQDLGPLYVSNVMLMGLKEADLIYFLRRWIGSNLTIRDCPEFTDNVINWMMILLQGEQRALWDRLRIENCSGFSVDSFVSLLLTRQQYVPDLNTCSVYVTGHYDPLSVDDWISLKRRQITEHHLQWVPRTSLDTEDSDSDSSMNEAFDSDSEDQEDVSADPETDETMDALLSQYARDGRPASYLISPSSWAVADSPSRSDINTSMIYLPKAAASHDDSEAESSQTQEGELEALLDQWVNI